MGPFCDLMVSASRLRAGSMPALLEIRSDRSLLYGEGWDLVSRRIMPWERYATASQYGGNRDRPLRRPGGERYSRRPRIDRGVTLGG